MVTSNISALPEVVGDAALLIDPHDAAAIAHGLREALTDQDLRSRLVASGLARAKAFSWDASVRRIREVYAEVAQA